jgi:hypothetical protein
MSVRERQINRQDFDYLLPSIEIVVRRLRLIKCPTGGLFAAIAIASLDALNYRLAGSTVRQLMKMSGRHIRHWGTDCGRVLAHGFCGVAAGLRYLHLTFDFTDGRLRRRSKDNECDEHYQLVS